MRKINCGHCELVLPPLGVGCWSYGGGEYWGAQSQQEVNLIVHRAVERGYGFFDTAEVYNDGQSEASLGIALQEISREKVTIATKISPLHAALGKAIECCESSLRRLRTDYIDLYMLHWPVTEIAIRHFSDQTVSIPALDEALASIDRLRRAGKIRHFGVSNFGPKRLEQVLSSGIQVVANELPYGLLNRAIEHEVLPFCQSRGIGVIGYMALLQGVLSDRYQKPTDVPETRRRTRHFDSLTNPRCRHETRGAEPETAAAVDGIRRVARQLEMTTVDVALRWAMNAPGVVSCLCGARSVAALEENIRAAEAGPLPDAAREELDRTTRPLIEKLGTSFDYYEHPANDRTR